MKVQPGLYRLNPAGDLTYATSSDDLRAVVKFDDETTMVFPVDVVPRVPQEIIDMFDRSPEPETGTVDITDVLAAVDLPAT